MAVALKIPDVMTVEEFLVWDSPGGYRWQLIDGVPVAMAPPSARHGIIQSELTRLLGNHLLERGGPCVAVTTPGVIPRSGCPGVRDPSWRKRRSSAIGRSYPARWSMA